MAEKEFASAAVIAAGKNARLVMQALKERGVACRMVRPGQEDVAERADVIVVGTLSPGPMLDAAAEARLRYPGKRIVLAWTGASATAKTKRVAA
jgi:hypothetical protein